MHRERDISNRLTCSARTACSPSNVFSALKGNSFDGFNSGRFDEMCVRLSSENSNQQDPEIFTFVERYRKLPLAARAITPRGETSSSKPFRQALVSEAWTYSPRCLLSWSPSIIRYRTRWPMAKHNALFPSTTERIKGLILQAYTSSGVEPYLE